MKKKMIIAAVAAVGVIVGITGFVKYQKKQVNLNDYITVEYTGFDTAGSAYADLDEEKLELAILNAKGIDADQYAKENIDWEDITSYFSSGVYELMDSVSIEATPANQLKNGDTVVVSVKFDEEMAKENGIRLKAKEEEFTVSGLEELTEVDPFAGVTVSYSGFAPNASISYENNSTDAYVDSLYFTADQEDGLDIGDTVTLTVATDEEMAMQNGYRFTQTSKEYTVDSADCYLTSYEDIGKDTLSDIQSEACDVIESYFAENTDYITAGELTYEGAYTLMAKTKDYWSSPNLMYLIYSTTVSSVNNEFEPTKLYLPVECAGLIQYATGKNDFIMGRDIEGISGLTYDSGWWAEDIAGYTDGKKMFNDLVAVNKAENTYEVTEGLTQFGE